RSIPFERLQYVHTTEDRASEITARLTTSTIVARNSKSEKAESVLNRKGEGPPNATGTLSARRRAARKTIHVAPCGRTAEAPVNGYAKAGDPGMPVTAEVDVPAGAGRRRSPKLLPRTGPKCLCGMKLSEGGERPEDLLRDACPARIRRFRIRKSSRLD